MKKLVIMVDCFKLIKGMGKSIGIYNVALRLIQNLVKEKNNSKEEQIKSAIIVVLGNKYNETDFNIPGAIFLEIKRYDPTNKYQCVMWELVGVAKEYRKLEADLILFPRGYRALIHPMTDIVLIHDLIPFYYNEHFPGFFNRIENAYIMRRLRDSAEKSNHIITISEASKQDIIKYCKVQEEKITVIYNASDIVDFDEEVINLENPYMCAITSDLPHKNAIGIFESYKQYCAKTDKPLNLIVIGIPDSSICDMPEEIRARITCYKFIKENKDMYRIIRNSRVFLFLSLIEGFGLPPIEAMQLDVPVICSNTSSLPEVVGDAAILVNPNDYVEIANNICRVLNDITLRDRLMKNGRKNIERFTGNSRAKKYWEIILATINKI